MGNFIAPRSDQLNADDLIVGPRTITVTSVRANGGSAEQPISINFDGDNGKPYKPCKSMRRVMVSIWGTNAAAYVGRSMTLYRDESVQFGGTNVGGIRISHMSHIDAPQTIALTATRARRAPFTVQPLPHKPAGGATTGKPAATTTVQTTVQPAAPSVEEYAACADRAAFDVLERRRADVWKSLKPGPEKSAIKAASDAASARIRAAAERPALNLSSDPVDTEAGAIAVLEAAYKQGRDELAATWARIEDDYASRNEPIPLALDAKISELRDALRE
jgi:hypothetical protein